MSIVLHPLTNEEKHLRCLRIKYRNYTIEFDPIDVSLFKRANTTKVNNIQYHNFLQDSKQSMLFQPITNVIAMCLLQEEADNLLPRIKTLNFN